METSWREIIEMAAVGQRAITQIEAIKSILACLRSDNDKVGAISAILGIKEVEKDA